MCTRPIGRQAACFAGITQVSAPSCQACTGHAVVSRMISSWHGIMHMQAMQHPPGGTPAPHGARCQSTLEARGQ
eukprot:3907018-Pleurochrysis_carterae.AAC.1